MYWSEAATHGQTPQPVRSHTCTLVGSKLFFFGGSDLEDNFAGLEIFDTETLFWFKPETRGEDLAPHKCHSATLVGDNLFIFGGGDGPTYFDTLYMLNTKTMTWSQPKTEGKAPGPRRAHTATLVDKRIFIFGGGDGKKALNEIFVLDADTMTWSEFEATPATKKDSVPGPRGFHTATLVAKDKILIFGGSDGNECFSDVFILDTTTKQWFEKTIVNPFPRLAHTQTLVGPMLFVFGGHDGCDYTNELNVLNIGNLFSLSLSLSRSLPRSLFSLSLVLSH
ncbi:Kelch motif, variant 2 [Balamuthia mandrillaris]